MSEWKKVKIGELFKVEKGSLQSSKCVSGDYDFITASSEWKTHKEYSHHTEALIVAVAASGSLGRVHYVNGKFISSDLCFILTPKDESIYPIDLGFYLHVFKVIRQDLVQRTAAGTSKLAINKGNFENYEVPYFDITHQRKYREKLIKFEMEKDTLLAKGATQKSLLKNLRQQILQDAIMGKLTKNWRKANPDVEPASELLKEVKAEKKNRTKKEKLLPLIEVGEASFVLPEGWEWCRFGDIVDTYEAGKSFKCSDRKTDDENEWGVIKTSAITAGRFIESENKFYTRNTPSDISKKISIGDLIFCRASGSKGLAGKCVLVEKCEGNLLLSDKTPRVIISPKIAKKYMYIHNEARISLSYYESLNTGKSTSMNNITKDQLFMKPLPLPPCTEQRVIVEKVDKLMEYVSRLEEKIAQNTDNAEILMQSFLAEAFKA